MRFQVHCKTTSDQETEITTHTRTIGARKLDAKDGDSPALANELLGYVKTAVAHLRLILTAKPKHGRLSEYMAN